MHCDLNVLDSIIFIAQMCLHHEPWMENNEGAETGSACGSEEARVRGSGLLVTAGAAQAGWL